MPSMLNIDNVPFPEAENTAHEVFSNSETPFVPRDFHGLCVTVFYAV
jgi:hypothetical protein